MARKGEKLTIAHRQKMREAKLKNPVRYWLGKKRSIETKNKISNNRKGKSVGPRIAKVTILCEFCGREVVLLPCYAKDRKYCSKGCAFSGKKNPRWKGGITPLVMKVRNSRKMKEWRAKVFKRDGYKCVLCGAKNGNGKTVVLNADHIKMFAYHPELRFELSNGRTLCRPCHRKQGTTIKRGHTCCYNEGYTQLGHPEFVRPVLQPIMAPIGGHCVLPNEILLKQSES